MSKKEREYFNCQIAAGVKNEAGGGSGRNGNSSFNFGQDVVGGEITG